jgi:hypothetical protein
MRLPDMKIIKILPGDVLHLKKPHPCGSFEFSVLRIGSDIRIKCNGCSRDMNVPREKLEKKIKYIISY